MRRRAHYGMAPTFRYQTRQGKRRPLPIPVSLYDSALTQAAYGNPQVLGDLFNDIMGAVVPGWENRPEALKKIQVKPNPATLFSMATKVVPPNRIGGVVRQANNYGFDMFYNTPAGSVPITPETAEGIYGNFPAFLRGQSFLSSIPSWAIMAGGMGLFLLVFMNAKKR